MDAKKLIHKEKLDIDDQEATLLSYDVVFSQHEMEQQIEQEEQLQKQQDINEALKAQEEEFQNQLAVAKQQAAQQGYENGFQEGRKEAEEVIRESISTFNDSLQELDHRLNKTLEEIEPGIISMVFDLAEKILQVPVKDDKFSEIVEQEVSQILRKISDDLRIEIYVSQHDEPAIRKLVNQIDTKRIEIYSDTSMNPGEYAVETSEETVIRHFKKLLTDVRDQLDIENWRTLEANND